MQLLHVNVSYTQKHLGLLSIFCMTSCIRVHDQRCSGTGTMTKIIWKACTEDVCEPLLLSWGLQGGQIDSDHGIGFFSIRCHKGMGYALCLVYGISLKLSYSLSSYCEGHMHKDQSVTSISLVYYCFFFGESYCKIKLLFLLYIYKETIFIWQFICRVRLGPISRLYSLS